MKRLSRWFLLAKMSTPAWLPTVPYILIGLLALAGMFGGAKVFKEWKYKKDIKARQSAYTQCVQNAMSHIELQECYTRIK